MGKQACGVCVRGGASAGAASGFILAPAASTQCPGWGSVWLRGQHTMPDWLGLCATGRGAMHGADPSGPAPAPHACCPPEPSPALRARHMGPALEGSSVCQGPGRGAGGGVLPRAPAARNLDSLVPALGQRRAWPWELGSGSVLHPQAPSSRCPCLRRARSPGAAWGLCR